MSRLVPRMALGLIASFWMGATLLVLRAGPVDSPLRSSRSLRRNMIAIAPQGWAFFTRDPREPVDRLYLETCTGWAPATYTNSSARNLFGLSRRARALNVELAALLAEAPREDWRACRTALEACLREIDPPGVTLSNRSLTRQMCGSFAVERRPPVPWAWSRSAERIGMPSEVIRLDVRCAPTH